MRRWRDSPPRPLLPSSLPWPFPLRSRPGHFVCRTFSQHVCSSSTLCLPWCLLPSPAYLVSNTTSGAVYLLPFETLYLSHPHLPSTFCWALFGKTKQGMGRWLACLAALLPSPAFFAPCSPASSPLLCTPSACLCWRSLLFPSFTAWACSLPASFLWAGSDRRAQGMEGGLVDVVNFGFGKEKTGQGQVGRAWL